ncbi:Probable poly(beta-D-mannuronate) O-acetylase [hydrothermal vent metagenome]|uniref:Probable poly(Beta-D-mannuronate) O-acetylase n=1 Tax=hydrothermal vent metagenome TaxID=652676 RepID=A0A3B1B7W1_9ZZZZ
MLFNSVEFIFLFLPITLLLFFFIGHRGHHRVAISWLVAASLFFYAWWNPAYLIILVISILFNYMLGVALSGQKQKALLIFGISANLGLLAYYKYANFLISNVNAISDSHWASSEIFLPLAISFFTFQQIAYLIDAYRGETREYNFLHYCLFVSFFPQLIAGPIVHHRDMLPQFSSDRKYKINYSHLAVGVSIFLLGLFKKTVIADGYSPYANEAFTELANGNTLTFFEAWRGAFAYTFQLYFDFSGYSDMAVGIARMFGILLPLNFNSPYKAKNIIEFWKQWHMTLSKFLRDYLYIPLGGNRKGQTRRYSNLILTMVLGGLWHGAGWTFIFWGLLHGLYLVINHAWHALKRYFKISLPDSPANTLMARLITFISIIIAWVFFRADSFGSAITMLKGMLGFYGVVWPVNKTEQLGFMAPYLKNWGLEFDYLLHFSGMGNLIAIIAMTLFVWYAPNVQQLMSKNPAVLNPPVASRVYWKANWRWALWIGLLGSFAILKLGKFSEFLYFQF